LHFSEKDEQKALIWLLGRHATDLPSHLTAGEPRLATKLHRVQRSVGVKRGLKASFHDCPMRMTDSHRFTLAEASA
jgi:hypothetical protein